MTHRRLVKTKICSYCNQEFRPFNSTQKYCSYKCLFDYRYKIKQEADCTKPKKCLYCEGEFKPTSYRAKYCSRKCFTQSVRKSKQITCPACEKEFLQRRVAQKYCSRECGEPLQRKPRGKFKKAYSDLLWANLVKLLANEKCEYCGKDSGLNSHHIFSRSNFAVRWDTDNGVCLCAGHHILQNFSAHKAPLDFAEWLRDKRGQEWYDTLRAKSKLSGKTSINDKMKIVGGLKERIASLRNSLYLN